MMNKYGADATRWYMISNSQPWDNLKFDPEGIDEVRRKLFGTLYNTYSFFVLYANIDGFAYKEKDIPINQRPEIDRWILSELNTLITNVDKAFNDYEPTKAARLISNFVDEYLSNWYVRLCRRRFWKGEYSEDKISAYQTLYCCLEVIAKLSSPIAPFFAENMFINLNNVTHKDKHNSVHLTDFPVAEESLIDKDLENRMQMAQKICSLVLSLRKRHNLKVRQPLASVMIPCDTETQTEIEKVKNLILSELNVKEIKYLSLQNDVLSKNIKANFKTLGPKYGSLMKGIAKAISEFSQQDIAKIETEGRYTLTIENNEIELALSDVEITTKDIEGWVVASEGSLTVALDTTITRDLRLEAIARELVNRIQNIRKDSNFEVTDNISVELQEEEELRASCEQYKDYICNETLTKQLQLNSSIDNPTAMLDILEGKQTAIKVTKY